MTYDYNEIASIYDDVRESDLNMLSYMLEASHVRDFACSNKSNLRILEIGCGTGNNLKLLEKLIAAELWGIDSSIGMLAKAKEKCSSTILKEDDATRLASLQDNMFDLVFMVDVIHHIRDINSMFDQIRRVLKPNGQLFVFSDNHSHIRNRLTTKYFPETLQVELSRYQDTDELVTCMLNNKFQNIQDGVVEIGVEHNFGQKLIDIAMKKGYSMFGLISEEAIQAGIQRIKEDMKGKDIAYNLRAPFVRGVKQGDSGVLDKS